MKTKRVADVLVRAVDQVLLVRYAHPERYDGERGWFLPDDYLRADEMPADAARRILRDQVGIASAEVVLDHTESFGDAEIDTAHVIHHFRTTADTTRIIASADLVEARWFDLAALPDRATVAHDGWALDIIGRSATTTRD